MLTLLAFVLALGLLITVHEYGHYRVARACGVKVLKFSIGFGKPIFSWRWAGQPTEFSIGLLPLGGYVSMLDERVQRWWRLARWPICCWLFFFMRW